MRVLWISCLLIGSITCGPVNKDSGSYNAASGFWEPSSGDSWEGGRVQSSGQDSRSPLVSMSYQSSGQAAASSGLGNPGSQSAGIAASSGSTGSVNYQGTSKDAAYPVYIPGSYPASFASGYAGSPSVDRSYVSVAEENYGGFAKDGNFDYGFDGGEDEESVMPVFSDVSDLDPVYSFSSRSRYQRGRRVFAKTRYTPGASQPPVMLGSNTVSSRLVSGPRRSVPYPTKGGFQ